MRYFYLSFISLMLSWTTTSCDRRGSTPKGADEEIPYETYCNSFNTALNGVFHDPTTEGTFTWKGGVAGTVEIAGAGYNDITCTYTVTDCEEGSVSMNCDGGGYDTQILLYTPDSIMVGQTVFVRVIGEYVFSGGY